MKKAVLLMAVIFVTFSTLVALSSPLLAAPYLVCDPYPDDSKPTHFELLVNGKAQSTPYALHASGAAIVLDLAGLTDGAHQITAIKACNERGCSSEVPLFVVPGLPSSLNGVRISP